MNVPSKMTDAIKDLYRQPSFRVSMEDIDAEWTPQETGIRQGCPLSPYLFLIVMNCLFHDVHQQDKLNLQHQRVTGMNEDEILYADDTICITQDEEAMERLLAEIEKEGSRYGLRLNRGKCEYLHFGGAGGIRFHDGAAVPKKETSTYLGCNINIKADPKKEINKRIRDCMVTLQKLHIFFYNSENTTARKIQIFNAVIRAKLMYGLETIVMNAADINTLDTFQLKCLRKILKLPTTYINRTYTNDYVRTKINEKLKETKHKPIETLTSYHKRTRIEHMKKLIRNRFSEPGAAVTFNTITLAELPHGKKRIGRPRLNWYQVTIQDLWNEARKQNEIIKHTAVFNPYNIIHRDALITFAEQ